MSSSMVSSQVRRRVSRDCGLVLMTWISTVQMVVLLGDVVFFTLTLVRCSGGVPNLRTYSFTVYLNMSIYIYTCKYVYIYI